MGSNPTLLITSFYIFFHYLFLDPAIYKLSARHNKRSTLPILSKAPGIAHRVTWISKGKLCSLGGRILGPLIVRPPLDEGQNDLLSVPS